MQRQEGGNLSAKLIFALSTSYLSFLEKESVIYSAQPTQGDAALPYKDKDKQKLYNKKYGAEWYQHNREVTLERSRKRKKEKRKEWHDYKAGLACFFCGFSHPAVIDFHHPDSKGETKVSYYVRQNQWKRAYQEAEKCIILCANCHRIYHYNERMGDESN